MKKGRKPIHEKVPVKRTRELDQNPPLTGYKEGSGMKQFVEDNENGKEDFEELLKAFVKPQKK